MAVRLGVPVIVCDAVVDVLAVGLADVVPVRDEVLETDDVTVGVPVMGPVGVACEDGVPEMVLVRVPDTELEFVCVGDRVIVEVWVVLRVEEKEGVKVSVGYAELEAVFVGVSVVEADPVDVCERVPGAV